MRNPSQKASQPDKLIIFIQLLHNSPLMKQLLP